MKLTPKEQTFLMINRTKIQEMVKKRIDDYKQFVIDETDKDRREVLVGITKELEGFNMLVEKLSSDKKKGLTGI